MRKPQAEFIDVLWRQVTVKRRGTIQTGKSIPACVRRFIYHPGVVGTFLQVADIVNESIIYKVLQLNLYISVFPILTMSSARASRKRKYEVISSALVFDDDELSQVESHTVVDHVSRDGRRITRETHSIFTPASAPLPFNRPSGEIHDENAPLPSYNGDEDPPIQIAPGSGGRNRNAYFLTTVHIKSMRSRP